MRIGALRHEIRLERPANVSDGAGGEVTAWSSLGVDYAEVLPMAGAKEEEGDVVTIGQQRYKVKLRYRDDVDTTCRLVWQRPDALPDLPMRIDSVNDPDGRRRAVMIYTTAGVPT